MIVRRTGGQILVIVLFVLMIAMTLVPVMVFFTQREAVWTAKQARSTIAFHLAEAGIEKGYLELTLSTQTWANLMKGGSTSVLTDYHYDKTYTDVSGGTYKISITSGPASQQATIMSQGTDLLDRSSRGIKAVYTNAPLGDTAIFATNGATIGGKVNVEWGSVMSPKSLDPLYASNSNYTWPQLWSASSITALGTTTSPPNCDSPDCCWWHSYQKGLPSGPAIDLNYYASQAKAAKASTYGCPAGSLATDCTSGIANDCCYYSSDPGFDGATITGGATVYVNTSINVASSHGGAYVQGAMIVIGNVTTSNGNFGGGTVQMTMPGDAWKQYCESSLAWPHYTSTFDSAAPATFPGLTNPSYQTPVNCSSLGNCKSKQIFSNGLLYVSGSLTMGGGGGGTDFYGVMYVLGGVKMTDNASNSTFYYNSSAASGMQLTQVSLVRQSWQDFTP